MDIAYYKSNLRGRKFNVLNLPDTYIFGDISARDQMVTVSWKEGDGFNEVDYPLADVAENLNESWKLKNN